MPFRRVDRRQSLLTGGAVALVLAAGSAFGPAYGQTLDDALASAYRTNPTLAAARAELRGVDEGLAQARAGWLPTVTVESSIAASSRFGTNDRVRAGTNLRAPFSADMTLSQPVYSGGSNFADYRQAKNQVRQQRALLENTEQTVLQAAVTAFMDVVRDQAVLELNLNNVQVLQRQLEATQDRFEVGENTRTDVAQAESRLSRAQANRIEAEGNLATSRATYQRVIGEAPGELEVPEPPIGLPNSLDAALSMAIERNPSVVASRFAELAAGDGVDSSFGNLLPSVSIDGVLSHDTHSVRDGSQVSSGQVGATLSIPIYQGGAVHSQVREAKQLRGQRRSQIDEARTTAIEDTVSAWEDLLSTRAQIESFEAEVLAAETALEGVTQENLVGARTVLDVLDAEQELLDAQVSLVTSRRDEIVASYSLLEAIGALTARQRSLQVEYYDPEINYDRVRRSYFGTGIGED